MSETYTVQLAASVGETIEVVDEVRHKIELSQVMDAATMKAILEDLLVAGGWRQVGEGYELELGAQLLRWQIDDGEVIARVASSHELETEVEASGWGTTQRGARQEAERLLAERQSRARVEIERARGELHDEAKKALEEGESARVQVLNRVIEQVYAKSLIEKAEHLGQVESINESVVDGQYELIIKVNCE